jgi:hypothetical protein
MHTHELTRISIQCHHSAPSKVKLSLRLRLDVPSILNPERLDEGVSQSLAHTIISDDSSLTFTGLSAILWLPVSNLAFGCSTSSFLLPSSRPVVCQNHIPSPVGTIGPASPVHIYLTSPTYSHLNGFVNAAEHVVSDCRSAVRPLAYHSCFL